MSTKPSNFGKVCKQLFLEKKIYLIYKIKKVTYSEKKVKSIKILRVKYRILFIIRLKAIKNIIDFFIYLLFSTFYS